MCVRMWANSVLLVYTQSANIKLANSLSNRLHQCQRCLVLSLPIVCVCVSIYIVISLCVSMCVCMCVCECGLGVCETVMIDLSIFLCGYAGGGHVGEVLLRVSPSLAPFLVLHFPLQPPLPVAWERPLRGDWVRCVLCECVVSCVSVSVCMVSCVCVNSCVRVCMAGEMCVRVCVVNCVSVCVW